MKNTLKMSKRQLKEYNECYILTNKHWIQKAYLDFEIDYSLYNKDNLQLKENVIFVKLKEINAIHVETNDLDNIYDIEFFINHEMYTSMYSFLGVEFSSQESYKEILQLIRDLFPNMREEEIKYGDLIYHIIN